MAFVKIFVEILPGYWYKKGAHKQKVTSQKVREHAVAHRGAEHPEYVSPKIHYAVHKSSPVSYGISLFPKVIEKLQQKQ